MDVSFPQMTEIVLSLALGIGLSAACGFRIFVPFLVMSAAAQSGYLELADSWTWIGSTPALLVFALATVLEIVAYYIPWLDNLLDTVATPAAVVAGVVATASVITDMSPLMTWTLAAIAGGGAAALVQTGTVLLRSISSTATLGAGNFVVASAEAAGAVGTSLLALVLPLVTLALVVLLMLWVWRRLRPRRATPLKGT
jgi:hypothetical protein